MKLNTAYQFMGTLKAVAVIGALFLIIAGWVVKSHAYTFEMDYSGPGSEYERSMEHYRDHENQEAAERVGRGEGRDNDQDKAEQYGKDHGA